MTQKERVTLSHGHWGASNFIQRMKVSDWRQILLNEEDTIMWRNQPIKLKARNIGAGVVEVYKDIEE